MFNILITSPSLDENKNVSGVSAVVKTIITNNKENNYFQFTLGSPDGKENRLLWALNQLLIFPRIFLSTIFRSIDIIHLNTPLEKPALIRDFPVFLFAKYILRKKILLHIHGGYLMMQPPQKRTFFYYIIKKIISLADAVLVLSEIEKQKILNDYELLCFILPNAVKVPFFRSRDDNEFEGKLNIAFLGRIVNEKGVFLISEMFRNLKDKLTAFRFHLYGAGNDLPAFLRELDNIESLDYTYHGVVKDLDKWQALRDAQIFLLPSLHGEGLPMAMLEAMATGCVVVASNDASILSVIENENNGYIFEKGIQNQFTSILKKILDNRTTLSGISNNAKNVVSEKYSIENYLKKLQSAYQMIISPTNPPKEAYD